MCAILCFAVESLPEHNGSTDSGGLDAAADRQVAGDDKGRGPGKAAEMPHRPSHVSARYRQGPGHAREYLAVHGDVWPGVGAVCVRWAGLGWAGPGTGERHEATQEAQTRPGIGGSVCASPDLAARW